MAESYYTARSARDPEWRDRQLRERDNRGVESWDSFGVVVGAASGALIGLLFVAISVNASRIVTHPALYVVATRTLVLFGIALVAAILVVTPGQAVGPSVQN